MPELYGIGRSNGLCPDDLVRLEKMGAEFPASRHARTEVEELSWAGTGAISLHANDAVESMRSENPPTGCFWIGAFQKDNEKTELTGLVESLHHREVSYLQWYDPPFAACVWDLQSRTVWLITDPYGLHPVYYAFQKDLLSFCTKVRPLLRSGAVDWQLDQQAILDFFTYEHVMGDRTLADSVKVLPPGTILSFGNGRLRMYSYLRVNETNTTSSRSVRHTSVCLYDELSSSVARSLRPGCRAAITLSGGLDSRALLGCAVAQGADVHAYTFGIPGCRDILYARELARLSGVPHSVVNIDASYLPRWLDHGIFVTGGMVSCIHYHILSLADILALEADVVLDGLGGDALTGNHLKWTMVMTHSPERAAGAIYRQRATAWATREAREQLFQPDFLRQTEYDPKMAVWTHFGNLRGLPLWVGCHHFDLNERQRRFIQYGPHLLRSCVTVRTPFYSPGVVNLMTRIPATHLIEQRAYLLMHSRHLRSLAGIPDSARNMPVSWLVSLRFGKKVLDFTFRHLPRRFSRFTHKADVVPTDYATWFRTNLRSFLEERLLGNSEAFNGVLSCREIEHLVREHLDGAVDHSTKLGCLLTFQAWRMSMRP